VQYCLDTPAIKLADVDYVASTTAVPEVRAADRDLPRLRAARLQSFRMAMPLWLKEKLFQKTLLREE